MNKRQHLNPVPITDKNGRNTTVYRKDESGTTAARILPTPAAPAVVDYFTDEDANAVTIALLDRLSRPSSLDWDAIARDFGYIRDWEHEWTDAEKRNIMVISDLADVLDKKPFTKKVLAEAVALADSLEPAVLPQQRGGYSSSQPHANNWRARDKMMHDVAGDMIAQRRGDNITYETAEPITNPRMLGLEAAQEKAFAAYNRPEYNKDGETIFGDVEPYLQESIARIVRGDGRPDWMKNYSTSDSSALPESERIVAALSKDDEGHIHLSQMYLATVFPVKELKAEMDRVGIDNVSVSSFYNTREWGNVYTVMTPDGSTRSFSVYEHRNTDSIIINGLADWDGEDLPYAADSKNRFFGEFGPLDRERAAQALTFYMIQAQQGELNDDDDLVRNAPRRDWNAILDEAIPGFKQWRQDKITDDYIAPADESEDEMLNRLDF